MKKQIFKILKKIAKDFDLILAKEDQPKPKPSPEGVIKAMEHFSAKPEESIKIFNRRKSGRNACLVKSIYF